MFRYKETSADCVGHYCVVPLMFRNSDFRRDSLAILKLRHVRVAKGNSRHGLLRGRLNLPLPEGLH